MRIGGKLLLVGVMLLLLLVPLALLGGLVSERQLRGQEVAADIARSSAGPQDVVGPLLLVEATKASQRRRIVSEGGLMREETEDSLETVFYLVSPDTLAVNNRLRIEQRGRSLFKVPLFHDALRLSGQFRHTLPASGQASPLKPVRAWLVLGLGDNRGVRALRLKLDGRPVSAEPGTRVGWLPEGLHAPVPLDSLDRPLAFDLEVDLTGTQALSWLPVGAETTVLAGADWPHPGFEGRHLPQESQVREDGFTASWAVSRLSSRVQQVLARCEPAAPACEGLEEGRFGVRLVDPVDRYLMTDRAMKYALLFLGLVFGAVFLVEALAARPVHVVQYGLTGLALAMFYLLLLSLSEHIGFGPAYGLAALACSGLLGYYLSGVLGGLRHGLGFGLGLLGLYGLLYTLLRSEDYALLVGAAVLFLALAGVMVLTRRVDWHRLNTP
ncbi:cell envelope integrity protein CreD [Arenimonas sp. MALMAid1274]|uniref:cell envelope integrity protein CreD n=1 Tax=Arenimonas sp. MALMAid1274 TaxID=3411630 RepID=UPI003BA39120